MKTRFRLLALTLLLAPLTCVPARAQLSDPKEEDHFVSYRQAPVMRLRELDYMQSYRKINAIFKKDPVTGEFVEEVYTAYVDAGWLADGKRQGAASPQNERFRITGRSRKVKLIRHETTIFAKITTLSRPIEGSEFELRAEGTYEMTVLEGSWEGYEKGGALKLALSTRDADRFSADLLSAHRAPRFLAWNATNFREMIIAGLRQSAADPAAPATGITPAEYEKVNVIVAPEYREQGMVFTFEDDDLLFDAEVVSTTMLYRSFFPPKEAAGASGNWRERYGFVTTPESFHLGVHGGGGQKPVHETLPKSRWPGW